MPLLPHLFTPLTLHSYILPPLEKWVASPHQHILLSSPKIHLRAHPMFLMPFRSQLNTHLDNLVKLSKELTG